MRKKLVIILLAAAALPMVAGCGPSKYDEKLCGIYSDLYQMDQRGDTLQTRDEYCTR